MDCTFRCPKCRATRRRREGQAATRYVCLPAAFASSSELSARATVRAALSAGSRATAITDRRMQARLRADGVEQPGGQRIEIGVDVGQDHGELVAAEPPGDVDRPAGRADRAGDAPQRLVAGDVAARVVQGLEVVEVDDDDGDMARAARRPVELLLEPLVERAVVQDAGQRILVDLASEILVELGVPYGQGGLRRDRAAEVDVALGPAPRGGVVRHLDQADGAAVDDQRQLDPGSPAPLDEAREDERRDSGVGHPLDGVAVGRTQQHARRRVVVEQVDVAPVILGRPRLADVHRRHLQHVACRVPDVDRALADAVHGDVRAHARARPSRPRTRVTARVRRRHDGALRARAGRGCGPISWGARNGVIGTHVTPLNPAPSV